MLTVQPQRVKAAPNDQVKKRAVAGCVFTCHCCPLRRGHLFRREAECKGPHPCHTTCEYFCFSPSLALGCSFFPLLLVIREAQSRHSAAQHNSLSLSLKPRKTSSRRAAPPHTRRTEGHAPFCLPPLDALKGFTLIHIHEAVTINGAHWFKKSLRFLLLLFIPPSLEAAVRWRHGTFQKFLFAAFFNGEDLETHRSVQDPYISYLSLICTWEIIFSLTPTLFSAASLQALSVMRLGFWKKIKPPHHIQ